MKKWLISSLIIIFIIAAIVLILPYGVGYFIQDKYPKFINSFSYQNLQIKIIDYRRHWFSSDAIIQLTVRTPAINSLQQKTPAQLLQYTFKQHIIHGPVIFTDTIAGEPTLKLAQAYVITRIEQADFSGITTTVVNFNDMIASHSRVAYYEYKNAQQPIKMVFKNFTSYMEFPFNKKTLNSTGDIVELDISSGNVQQQTQGVHFQAQLQRTAQGLLLGTRDVQFANNIWQDTNSKKEVTIQGITLHNVSQQVNDNINSQTQLGIKAVILNKISYGPHYLNFAVLNFNVPAFLAFKQEATKLQSNAVITSNQLNQVNQLFMGLIEKGLIINITKLEIATPWGKPNMTAALTLKPQVTNSFNSLAFLQALKADVNVHLPITFLNQGLALFYQRNIQAHAQTASAISPPLVPQLDPQQLAQQQINQWISNGWLNKQGNVYNANIHYENNQTLINGKLLQPTTVNIPVNIPATHSPALQPGLPMSAPTTIH